MKKLLSLMPLLLLVTSCGGGGSQGGQTTSTTKQLEGKDLTAFNALIAYVNDPKAGWHDKTTARYVNAEVSYESYGIEGVGGSIYCNIRGTNAYGAYLTQAFHIILDVHYNYKFCNGPEKSSSIFNHNNIDVTAVNNAIAKYWGV